MPKIPKCRRVRHVKGRKKKPGSKQPPSSPSDGSSSCVPDLDNTSRPDDISTDTAASSIVTLEESNVSVSSYPESEHSYHKKDADESFPGVEAVPNHVASMEILLEARRKLIAVLPPFWTSIVTDCTGISALMMSRQSQLSLQRSIKFCVNGDVVVSVHCKEVPSDRFLSGMMPALLLQDSDDINYFVDRALAIVSKVRLLEVCAGVDLEKYSISWPYCSNIGSTDTNPYMECRYVETFRVHDCVLLVDSSKWRCTNCKDAVKTLRRKTESLKKAAEGQRSSKTANIFLTEEEKLKKLSDQQKTIQAKNQVIRRLNQKMKELIDKEGKKIDEVVAKDLTDILRDADMSPAQSMFVQQQVKASQFNNKSSMKWHPSIIRLALSIFEISRSAYERLRDSGFITLPCSRTLYDYTHTSTIQSGVDPVVIESVSKEVSNLPEKQSYHVLMADEMYISKNLVYKKSSGELIGYTSLNDVDKELKELDEFFNNSNVSLKEEVATKVLCYLVKGIANSVKQVVASYAVNSVSTKQYYSWTWHLISTLEKCNVKIISFICDGCPTNRAFINMHQPSHASRQSKVVYATWNKAAPHRQLFFVSDVPHLLKTLRNSFFRSRLGKKGKRCMTKNGQKIVWDHIIKLYNAKKGKALRKSYKLTAQHVYPDSYTCMRVSVAGQVLSKTVGKDLQAQNWAGTASTVEFILKVNDWFDSLNGAHSSQGKRTRNKRLEPYRTSNDFRFEELSGFLEYLEEWKQEAYNSQADASAASGLSTREEEEEEAALWGDDECDEETRADKKLPAKQTLLGIEMSTLGILAAIRFLLDEVGVGFINARIFCQDPLEHYFGKQRAGCGGSNNPNLSEFLNKARVSHVVGQIGIKRKGNSTEADVEKINLSDAPLEKRKRTKNVI